MLNKQNRLKKNKEFQYIFKRGESYFNKYLAVFFVKTKIIPIKIGFNISSKIGNSVVRHKLKRIISERVRELLPNINKKYNYVIVCRMGIEDLPNEKIRENVDYLLNKAGLIENI